MDALTIILQLISQNFSSDAAFEVAAGLKPKTVYDWKRGKSSSYIKILPKLSKLFDVSIDDLLGNEQKISPSHKSDGQDPKNAEIIQKLAMLNSGNRDSALALIDSLLKNQEKQ